MKIKLSIQYYYSDLLYKKYTKDVLYKLNQGCLFRLPLFSRKISVFELLGQVIQYKKKGNNLNQSMTVVTVVSKNKVYYVLPIQCPVITFI